MTLSEFKAWFEGFTEGMEGAPTADQFAKIKAKVEKIDGAVTTYPVFVDRWWPREYVVRDYSRPYWGAVSGGNLGYATGAGSVSSQALGASSEGTMFAGYGYKAIDPTSKGDTQTITFDSHAAMRDLGRMEAAA